jgi:hypothetical protein
MKTIILSTLVLFCSSAFADEPTPAPSQRFSLPLADGSTTQAIFLPAPNDAFHLVYATKSGTLVILNVSKTQPGPQPPVPPPPFPAKLLKIAVVHDPFKSTTQQRQVMCDMAWRDHIPAPHKFCGILPYDLIDPNSGAIPDAQAPFLEAGQNHALPCLILLNEENKPIAIEPLPDSASGILELIRKHGGQTNEPADNQREQLPRSNRPTHRQIGYALPAGCSRLFAQAC